MLIKFLKVIVNNKKYSLFILFALLFVLPVNVYAQLKNSVSVTPSLVRLKGNGTKSIKLSYKNPSDLQINIHLELKKYKIESNGGLSLENLDSNQQVAVKLEAPDIVLKPRSQADVNVDIAFDDLAPGGNYIAVKASLNPEQESDEVKNIKFQENLISILMLRSESGQVYETAKIDKLECEYSWFRLPKRCFFNYKNEGNIELVPFGSLEIKNDNNKISKSVLNSSSLYTLPKEKRSYFFSLLKYPSIVLPGKYEAVATVRYGEYDEKNIKIAQDFITLGSPWIVISELSFLIFIILLIYKGHRLYR